MKIVHILMACAHGQLSSADLLRGTRGVTGSEQAMLFLARESARRGHRVVVYLPTQGTGIHDGVCYLDYVTEYPRLRELDTADVVISWITADPLVRCRPDQLRIYSIQVNDWQLNSAEDPRYPHVDCFLCVSQSQREWLWQLREAPTHRTDIEIVPNGVDVMRFARQAPRQPLRCLYTSSPDRGLHWLLYFWPEIRLHFPTAMLHIYYEIDRWVQGAQGLITEIGQRARYINQRLRALQGHGVVVEGPVSPVTLADSLLRSDFFLYPCDPVSHTEGFSVSTMEACAAGCLPIITDADALGEVYGQSGAILVPRTPGRDWIDNYLSTVLKALEAGSSPGSNGGIAWHEEREHCRAFAKQYDWGYVADQFHAVLERRLTAKREVWSSATTAVAPGG